MWFGFFIMVQFLLCFLHWDRVQCSPSINFYSFLLGQLKSINFGYIWHLFLVLQLFWEKICENVGNRLGWFFVWFWVINIGFWLFLGWNAVLNALPFLCIWKFKFWPLFLCKPRGSKMSAIFKKNLITFKFSIKGNFDGVVLTYTLSDWIYIEFFSKNSSWSRVTWKLKKLNCQGKDRQLRETLLMHQNVLMFFSEGNFWHSQNSAKITIKTEQTRSIPLSKQKIP